MSELPTTSLHKQLNRFYLSKDMMKTSRGGYYSEKKRFFLNALQHMPNTENILDIACNDGQLTESYAKYGRVIGIDINHEAIQECKKKGLECICCETEELLPAYNNFFDVIIAGDIIEHIFDTDMFLSNIYKLLKPSGSLLLTTPNIASLGRRIMLLRGSNPFIEFSTQLPTPSFNVGHIRYYTQKNLKEQLAINQFVNTHISGDRINFGKTLHIPYPVAKYFPFFARNLLVHATK